MLGIGENFPKFSLKAVDGKPFDEISMENVFIDINEQTYDKKWLVIFFYPKDFTFVYPTEIAGFADLEEEFSKRNAQILAGSTDSEFVHWAWRKHEISLRELPFPMMADINRELTSDLGILDKKEGVAQRATFIVDTNRVIRHVSANDLSVGRNPLEILRVLDALQTGELCPCNWQKGDNTIDLGSDPM